MITEEIFQNKSILDFSQKVNLSQKRILEVLNFNNTILERDFINKGDIILEISSKEDFTLKEKFVSICFLFEYIGFNSYKKEIVEKILNKDGI